MLHHSQYLVAVTIALVVAGCQPELVPPAEAPTQPTPVALLNWANTWAQAGDWDQAIMGYTETIQLYPTYEPAYNARGGAWEQKGEWEKAIADYSEAIRLNPDDRDATNRRRLAWGRAGEWDKVIAEYSELLVRRPNDPLLWNNRAWVLATCPVARFRDGTRAVADAERAVELIPGPDPMILDTLAAALAEAGDFERAVEAQKKALASSRGGRTPLGKDAQTRLTLYEQKKTYQEPLPPLATQPRGPALPVRTHQ